MENGFVDVTSIEEQQDEADFEQNTSSNKDGSADPPAVPALTRVVEIERIVDERGRGAKKSSEQHEYLVKWKSVKQCWLSAADLKKFPQLTEAFEKRKGQKSTARNEDEVARDGAEHHDETDDNDANQYTDHDYTGTQQVPSKHPLQNGGIAKSDDLVRSSSRQHRPTKRFVEETNEAVERGKKARRTSPRKSGKKAGKSVLKEGNDEEEEQDVEYAVEKVLKKRERGSRVQYRVKWAGYDSSYNSWEPRNGLKHLDIVKQFEQEQSALEEKTDDNLEEDKKEKKNEEEGEEEQDEEEEEEEEDDGKEYKVERILEKRVGDDGELEYLVKWVGYDSGHNSWEPRNGLKHLEVVKRFEEEEQSALEPKSDKPVSSKRSSRASSRATVSTPVSLKGTTSSTIVMNKRVRVVIRKEEPVAGPSTDGVGKAEAADAEPKTVGKKRKKRARY